MTTIERNNDIHYGAVFNGGAVGSGYDVTIKREDDSTAIVSVEKVGTKMEWLVEIDVDADQDLQSLAKQIGQCPSAELEGSDMIEPDDEDWSDLAERWDAITFAANE